MDLLIFLAAVVFSVDAQLIEPDDLHYECSGGPDTADNQRVNVQTFDGSNLKVVDSQISRLATWNVAQPCNYHIIAATTNDASQGLQYDWMAIGIGRPSPSRKRRSTSESDSVDSSSDDSGGNNKGGKSQEIFQRIWILDDSTSHIHEKIGDVSNGRYFEGAALKDVTGVPHFYADGEVFFVATSARNDGVVRIRSNTCPYAIDWIPDSNDGTQWRIHIDQSYAGSTFGLCQNANGNPSDDDLKCPNKGGHISRAPNRNTDSFWKTISKSCEVK